MSIGIHRDKCIGCKKCTMVCPGNLLEMDIDKKVIMKYKKDCWGCASCIKECNYEAIYLYLGADIGGRGNKMYVKKKDEFIYWKVRKLDGSVYEIKINPKDSNEY